ncbi:MAG: recombinase family protein [Pseudomonadota bacterium]
MIKAKRCAIYTRKSSEEGLEQSFNSLDAQHEVCASYVVSQRGEGWRLLRGQYDDGGVSGGTMDRHALSRLLHDIALGKVDVVVVYNIDRLTRSLADFARMVEIFERHDVNFVSVTQAFNTTSSMGRLTFNVLLFFAQFERELTGERIRDRIAASKAKGMWMGGCVPLGYDAPLFGTHTLLVNDDEAEWVRHIFTSYLHVNSVAQLTEQLRRDGIRSKTHAQRNGKVVGGVPFSRGALFHLLRNKIYLGLLSHKGQIHDGLHQAIVDRDLFEAVQAKLDTQKVRQGPNKGRMHAALAGRVFDAEGARMTPTFAVGARGKRYPYYVSAPLQQGARNKRDGVLRRVSGPELEEAIADTMGRWGIAEAQVPFTHLSKVVVAKDRLTLELPGTLLDQIADRIGDDETVNADKRSKSAVIATTPWSSPQRGGQTAIERSAMSGPRSDPVLIRALRQAHRTLQKDSRGLPFLTTSPKKPHQRKLVRLAHLAPDIQCAILTGTQPPGLTLNAVLNTRIPLDWQDQRTLFLAETSAQ